jgi:hypothetical protein
MDKDMGLGLDGTSRQLALGLGQDGAQSRRSSAEGETCILSCCLALPCC